MEKRYARVVFNREVLRKEDLGKYELIQLLEALPDDAVLVGMHEDLACMDIGMVFKSEKFKVSKEGQYLPVIIAKWTRDGDDDCYSLDVELDMSEALDPNFKKPNWSIDNSGDIEPRIPYTIPQSLQDNVNNMMNEYMEQTIYGLYAPTFISTKTVDVDKRIIFRVDTPDTHAVTGKGESYTIPKDGIYQITAVLTDGNQFTQTSSMRLGDVIPAHSVKQEKSCEHDWKRYEGLMYQYNYCTKCDRKQTDA